jgi:hypothetical protein
MSVLTSLYSCRCGVSNPATRYYLAAIPNSKKSQIGPTWSCHLSRKDALPFVNDRVSGSRTIGRAADSLTLRLVVPPVVRLRPHDR